jgi:hypothetical protein
VAVAAMAREQHIPGFKLAAHPHRHGFLARGQVWKPGNLASGRQALHLALEQPYPPQCAVHLLPFIQ